MFGSIPFCRIIPYTLLQLSSEALQLYMPHSYYTFISVSVVQARVQARLDLYERQ